MKKSTNLLVGARIVIDYPSRWRGASDAATQARLRAETEASKKSMERNAAHYFGETALIVNYSPGEESGKEYDVLLDSNREIVALNQYEFTVAEMPKPSQEVVTLLERILQVLDTINKKTAHH